MESRGRKIHGQAAHAREAGQHLEALKLYDEAILAYQQDNDILGLAEVFADRSICYRHLAEETGDQNFLIIAKHYMLASVEIAEKSGDEKAVVLPYFQTGRVYEELGELENAKGYYQKAVENMISNPPDQHNRPAILADMMVHLSTCEYRAGDTGGLERALDAMDDLEKSEEVRYNKDVWLSGGHMRISEMLKVDDPEKAKEHLQKAKEIIDANPDLKTRKQQWEKLSNSL